MQKMSLDSVLMVIGTPSQVRHLCSKLRVIFPTLLSTFSGEALSHTRATQELFGTKGTDFEFFSITYRLEGAFTAVVRPPLPQEMAGPEWREPHETYVRVSVTSLQPLWHGEYYWVPSDHDPLTAPVFTKKLFTGGLYKMPNS